MRKEILELQDLGRMPNESINDDENIDNVVNSYDSLLEKITLPITYDEGEILINLFPENAFYDLQWSLLKLIESLEKCPSEEWRNILSSRYNNWAKKKN